MKSCLNIATEIHYRVVVQEEHGKWVKALALPVAVAGSWRKGSFHVMHIISHLLV